MASDWRLVRAPLAKTSCAVCGLVFRDPQLPPSADFSAGYELYAHAAGEAGERRRQSEYAAWIAASVRTPTRVLDVGCGNGSLLLALRERWPHAALTGCDPSPSSIRHATAAGLTAWVGTVADLPGSTEGDLVISVNVIEHTSDRPGANRSARVRRAVNQVYSIPLIAQQISLPEALGGKYRDDPALARLLGYESDPAASVLKWRERRLTRAR